MLRLQSMLSFVSLMLLGAPSILSQVEWTASVHNPVLTPGEPGTWDSEGVGAGALLKDRYGYKCYYPGYNCSDQGFCIQGGCATSKDLITWEKFVDQNGEEAPCLRGGPPGAWDEVLFGFTVVHVDGDDPEPYKMWYHGSRAPWTTNPTSIGFATSDDGLHWNKFEDNPVLTPAAGTWETSSLAWPNVVFDKKRSVYRMWFSGQDWNDCNSGKRGYAESSDGIKWTRCPSNPVFGPEAFQGNVGKAHVLFDEATGLLEMFYDSSCGGLDYATSLDGKTWLSYPGNPLPVAGESTNIRAGPVLWDDGTYHMLYARFADPVNAGYATAPWTLPRASFTLDLECGDALLKVTADASLSAVPPGQGIDGYSWDFGDGTKVEAGRQVEHAYQKPGEYLLKLTVTSDPGSAQGSVARKVSVSFPGPSFRRGDANSDGAVDLSDAIFTLSALFLGGDLPDCADAADSNDDGADDLSDGIYTLSRLFTGGLPIPDPGPDSCGLDPTPDDLCCVSGSPCP